MIIYLKSGKNIDLRECSHATYESTKDDTFRSITINNNLTEIEYSDYLRDFIKFGHQMNVWKNGSDSRSFIEFKPDDVLGFI